MLGDRHGDAGNVNLLERVAADEAGADVAGDGNHRDGIHIRGSNTGYKVGRTRPLVARQTPTLPVARA